MGSNRDLGKSRVRFCEVEARVGDQREHCRFWGSNFECPDFVSDMRFARRLKRGRADEQNLECPDFVNDERSARRLRLGYAAEQNFECPDFVNDVRPAGRPKRGLAAERNFEFKSCRNATERNVNPVAQKVDSDIDEDYEPFLNAGVLGNYVNPVTLKGGSDIDGDYEVFLNAGILGNYGDYTVDGNVRSNNSLKNFSKGGSTGTPKILREVGGGKKILKVRKSATVKQRALVSGPRSKSSIKIRNKKKVNSTEQKSVHEIYDDYSKFVLDLRIDGISMICTTISGEVIRYGGDEECSYDSDIIVMDRDPCQNRIPRLNLHRGTTSDNSELKEKLMSLLREPYSQEEYDKLWQLASYQRKREKRPETMACGRKHKSYFDEYPDLKQKINSVKRDRRKVLNLLRGFFYWLYHVSDEQSFVPWLDPSCLETISDDQRLVLVGEKRSTQPKRRVQHQTLDKKCLAQANLHRIKRQMKASNTLYIG